MISLAHMILTVGARCDILRLNFDQAATNRDIEQIASDLGKAAAAFTRMHHAGRLVNDQRR